MPNNPDIQRDIWIHNKVKYIKQNLTLNINIKENAQIHYYVKKLS